MIDTGFYIALYSAMTLFFFLFAKKDAILSPFPLFIGVYTLIYGIGAPLYPVYFPEYAKAGFESGVYGHILIGYAAGGAGIFLGKVRNKILPMEHAIAKESKLEIIMMLAAAATIALSVIWVGRIGGVTGADFEYARTVKARDALWIRQFTSLGSFALMFYMAYVIQAGKPMKKALIFMAVIVLCIALQGYRSFFISIIVILGMIIYRLDKKKLSISRIAMATAIMMAISMMYGYIRFQSSNFNPDVQKDAWEYGSQYLYIRSVGLQKITDMFPMIEPYQQGALYLRGLGFLLPGEQLSPGRWLKEEVFRVNFAGGGMNPGILGEFYINFGSAGIMIGMLLYGYALAKFYNYYIASKSGFALIFGANLYFYTVMSISPGIATIFITVFWAFLMTVFYEFIIRAKIK